MMIFILVFFLSFSACSQTAENSQITQESQTTEGTQTAQNSQINQESQTTQQPSDYVWNLDNNSLAVNGYDVVAYFSLQAKDNAVKGKPEFSYQWAGAVWQFSSQENLDKFKAQPEKYAPKYGGYCAYAAARNYLFSIDPNAWTVEKGELYLNANKRTRKRWLKNTTDEISQADKNWPSLKEKAKK